MLGGSVAPAMPQAAGAVHLRGDEVETAACGVAPGVLVEHHRGVSESFDHQAIPIGQDLVVTLRRHPAGARRGQRGEAAAKGRFLVVGAQPPVGAAIEDRMVFPVATGCHVIDGLEQRGVGAEQAIDLRLGPHIELAFDTLAVGIESAGKGEGAVRAVHTKVAQRPVDGLPNPPFPERVLVMAPELGEEIDEQGVVVEHFLEMRHEPDFIGGITGEAAADVIVDAALTQRGGRRGHGVAEHRRTGPEECPPQEAEKHRLRKLRCPGRPPLQWIDDAHRRRGDAVDDRHAQAAPRRRARQFGEAIAERRDVGRDLVPVLAVGARDGLQNVGEAGTSVAWRRGEIGSAPEGMPVRSEEHGQRPAALLTHHRQGRLINGIDVRPLLAIDFDVDEQIVHYVGNFLRFKAFMGHDMAPVARGIADGQQDRLVVAACFIEHRRPPGSPMHGVVPVLEQVRAGLAREEIFCHGVGMSNDQREVGRPRCVGCHRSLGWAWRGPEQPRNLSGSRMTDGWPKRMRRGKAR